MKSKIQQQVACRYIEKNMKKKASDKDITPDRFIDLIAFSVAFDAFQTWAEETEASPGALGKRGMAMMKRYSAALSAGIDEFILPLDDRSDAGPIKPALKRGLRPGSPNVVARNRARMFLRIFRWLKNKQIVLKDIFPGKATRPALMVSHLAEEETPVAILSKCVSIPTVSGLSAPRKWIKDAANMVGVGGNKVEEVLGDAESANALADEIQRVQGLINNADPSSPEYAAAIQKKEELMMQLETMSESSSRPEVVLSSVASKLADQPTPKTAKQAGLNTEQTKAMLAEGKVVITAGAGAGKTRTVAAKIAYFVNEKGYRPDQILATSFTNKSATELQERVAQQYNITETRIGTTHNIAREILFDFSNIPRDVVMKATSSGLISTLIKLAIEQVKLSPTAGKGYGGGGYYRRRRADLKKQAAWSGSSPYWKKAVGEWFNLGSDPRDNRGRPIGTRRISTAIGVFQGHAMTPEEAWRENSQKQNGMVMYYAAAVYGAYTWLKKNDPQYGPALDFDDWLTEAVRTLKENPKALQSLQRRFKIVMVDEAQDLNRTQHELFGLIAQKADTFAMVGDDAQAIYSFRGAVPEEFTSLPSKGFKVETLTMNFRSGKNIVDAANRLIAHNEDRQIPKVCRADVERKGMGQIQAVELPRHEDCAVLAAQEIADQVETGSSPNDFGILVRNNAEADAFCLALMAKGIPFKSKRNFFNQPAVKSLAAWLTIAAGGSDTAVNDAVVNAHSTPGFFLDRKFEAGLQEQSPSGENYLEFLLGGGRPYVGNQAWRNERMVIPYVEALRHISELEGDTETIIREILALRGSKQTFLEALLDQVDPEDVAEANNTLEPSDEMMREAALAPLRPMMEMAKKFTDPKKFMDFLHKMVNASTQNHKKDEDPEPAVMVDTIHQWKGLERKNVYTVMAQGVFPHRSTESAFESGDRTAFDDERRLAYVAITRGQDSVTILCPDINYMGMDAGPSRFVDEACVGFRGETPEEADPEAQDQTMMEGLTASTNANAPDHFVTSLNIFLRRQSSLEDVGVFEETELDTLWKGLL